MYQIQNTTAAILESSVDDPLMHELQIPSGLSVYCMCLIIYTRFFRKNKYYTDDVEVSKIHVSNMIHTAL